MMAKTSAVVPSGSWTLRSAPASASARAVSIAPCRAANISGVQPPRGNGVFGPPLRGKLSLGVSSTVDRALMSAPASTSARVTSTWLFGRGPHHRRLAEEALLGVDVGAVASSSARPDVAGAARGHQHGLAFGHHRIGVGARASSSAFRSAPIAVDGGERQRRHAVAVGRLDVGTGRISSLTVFDVVGAYRPVQRRRAVGLGDVDVGLLPNQRPHRRCDRPPSPR